MLHCVALPCRNCSNFLLAYSSALLIWCLLHASIHFYMVGSAFLLIHIPHHHKCTFANYALDASINMKARPFPNLNNSYIFSLISHRFPVKRPCAPPCIKNKTQKNYIFNKTQTHNERIWLTFEYITFHKYNFKTAIVPNRMKYRPTTCLL